MSAEIASDTSEEVSLRLVAHWRAMSSIEKAELVSTMCREADELARLGIAFRHGTVSDEQERLLLAERRYGEDFARQYFGPNSPAVAQWRRSGFPGRARDRTITSEQ